MSRPSTSYNILVQRTGDPSSSRPCGSPPASVHFNPLEYLLSHLGKLGMISPDFSARDLLLLGNYTREGGVLPTRSPLLSCAHELPDACHTETQKPSPSFKALCGCQQFAAWVATSHTPSQSMHNCFMFHPLHIARMGGEVPFVHPYLPTRSSRLLQALPQLSDPVATDTWRD